VVVIGSGATAVTLVPAMAERAAHVTMLQRSPTYVMTRPARDPIANALRRVLPARAAYAVARWKNVLMGIGFFTLSRRRPAFTRRLLMQGVRKELGPGYDVDTHFAPRYGPWDERLCLVPDADLFAAFARGRPRWSPTTSRRSPSAGCGCARGRSSRPTWSSRRRGSTCTCCTASRSSSTAHPWSWRARWRTAA
jgi:cation diffusion facilitator CzcD-associated flavoprotein CzcO